MGKYTIGLITGGFDPIHSGHIDLIRYAAERNTIVVVGLNSNDWLVRKKGAFFQDWHERYLILTTMYGIDDVIRFNDEDDSASDAIAQTKDRYHQYNLNFYSGADSDETLLLEILRYEGDPKVTFHYDAGDDYQKQSSRNLLNRWVEIRAQSLHKRNLDS